MYSQCKKKKEENETISDQWSHNVS